MIIRLDWFSPIVLVSPNDCLNQLKGKCYSDPNLFSDPQFIFH